MSGWRLGKSYWSIPCSKCGKLTPAGFEDEGKGPPVLKQVHLRLRCVHCGAVAEYEMDGRKLRSVVYAGPST